MRIASEAMAECESAGKTTSPWNASENSAMELNAMPRSSKNAAHERSTRPKPITRKGETDGAAGGHGLPTRSMQCAWACGSLQTSTAKQQTSSADFDHVTQTSI